MKTPPNPNTTARAIAAMCTADPGPFHPAAVTSKVLRALLIFTALPAGCVAAPVTTGDLSPHLKPGEFAVVDTADRDPQHGELYLVAWMGPPDRDGNEQRALVQAFLREHQSMADGGASTRKLWSVGSMRCGPRPREEVDRLIRAGRYAELGWSNGPYREGVLERQIRGRVIGILAPSFEEPKRLPRIEGGAA